MFAKNTFVNFTAQCSLEFSDNVRFGSARCTAAVDRALPGYGRSSRAGAVDSGFGLRRVASSVETHTIGGVINPKHSILFVLAAVVIYVVFFVG